MSKIQLRAASLLLCAVLLLCGCSTQLYIEDSDNDGENIESQTNSEADRPTVVTIIQYIDSAPLNECCAGVKNALDNDGVGYDVVVGSDKNAVEDCTQAAQDIAINSSRKLIIAIGTPCAETVCPIVASAGTIPVVFCAVTDPVGAGIVDSIASPGVNCTGVATTFNISEQLNMINSFQPSITRLGVLYTEGEQNTQAQLKSLKKSAERLGITVYTQPVEDPAALPIAAKELMTKVEAVTLLPDNQLARDSWGATERSIVEQVPLYGVTRRQVSEGCIAGYCYDFESVGRKAGEQAVKVLHGESAAEMPVIVERQCTLYVNSDRISELYLEIPEKYRSAAQEVKTEYDKN